MIVLSSSVFSITQTDVITWQTYDNADSNTTHVFDKTSKWNGTITNAVRGQIGANAIRNEAVYFDGTQDYIRTIGLYLPKNNFTISYWFKATSTSGNACPCGSTDNGNLGAYGIQPVFLTTADYSVGMRGIATGPSTPVVTNVWYHMVYIKNISGQFMYKNNSLVASGTAVGDKADYTAFTSTGYWHTGGFWYANDNAQDFNGYIDEVIIINNTVSTANISKLYNNGIGISYDGFFYEYGTPDAIYNFTNVTGTYTVLNYTSVGSATWIVPPGVTNLTVLVVGAGGAGGQSISGVCNGAGGGGGGLIYNQSYSVTTGETINIYVGAGGVGNSSNGGNSWFGTANATGGGGGECANNGKAGGSGGGAGGTATAKTGGAGVSGQGYAGGNNNGAGTYVPGGGGGCGGVGGTGVNPNVAGVGIANSISNTSITYCGGGIYVAGGGNGPANTGRGGNANINAPYVVGNGGSGIVIIQYQLSTNLSNFAPVITYVNTTIGATTTTCNYYNATDMEGDAVTPLYNWYNNSVITSYTTETILNTLVRYNETWNCSVTPYDGITNGTKLYSTAFSGNITFKINVFDLYTGNPILTASTINLNNNATLYNYTFNSSINITNMNNGIYNYTVTSSGYVSYVPTITLPLNTTTTLDLYLTNSSVTTIFTIQEKGSSNIIEGVSITVKKYIGLVLVTVDNLVSDITGKAQIHYIPSETYYFVVSKTGYINKTFSLNPILFSDYVIMLDKTTSSTDSSDFVGVLVSHSPYSYVSGANTFNATIIEPLGNLTSYGVVVSYPGGVYTDSGVNPVGELFTSPIIIVGATNQSTVNVTIYYQLTGGNNKTFNYKYPITFSALPGTFIYNVDHTYGMGVLERVLIVTLFVILVAGIVSYYGNPVIGGVVGIFIFVYFAYVGFISFWLLIIPIFSTFIIIIWRGSQ
jgi:hypothetical protein